MTDPTTPPAAGSMEGTGVVEDRVGRRGPNAWEIGIGLALLGFGTWFFLDLTVGLDLPRLAWRDLWPIILIAVGGFIVLGAALRRSD